MSSAAIISTVPTVNGEALREKAPINVDINPVPATNVDIKQTSSTSPVEPKSASEFELEDHPIDIKPKIRVAVIGAGLAGITAGVLLPVKVPGIDLTIFDKNADVGGTWFENIYPGVRCDIPANVYQSTFEPNTQWSEEYAQGAEIRDYWQAVARKYNVYQYLKLKRRIIGATWSETDGSWTVEVENLETGEKSKEIFNVVITAIGRFNAWRLPDYSGIKDYKGHLRHASAWDPTFDPAGKTVAVIGNGASGIQLVPNLQKVVKHLDHYARSKTWIAGSFGGEGAGRRLEPNYYAAELLKTFEDPEVYRKFRKELESKFYRRFGTIFKDSKENNGLREEFITLMSTRLSKKPELLEHIVPDFSPNCRRLTPGPGYLEALTEDNVSFIRDPISHFTAEGIVTADGTERKVDAVICATGANIDMIPPFPITANGRDLRDAWRPDPISYIGVAAPGFPNLLFIQGPNAAGHSGTVPNQVETQVTYLAKLLRKVSTQNIKSFAPSQAATDDFVAYSDKFFERTVFSGNCSSWANGGIPGARIHGHWPGSASHLNIVRRNPRWEDWEWTTKARSGNRFAWFGNGWTAKEESGEGDLTPYLKVPASIDLRSYHEEWFEGL
ncbi:putative sterigmatocystin biosynthesis monooxygenase [Lachnellula arida]|uniref:Putative sterigmatocystin biosynthesis monooxygenase n=1 Tax=Lachnellula arida TaxID=1316785 RepID=A0A8T9BBW9_9HELO|nr:putative sterigmatocystin biosynthesis monooxygenase [Lachnellula arida]